VLGLRAGRYGRLWLAARRTTAGLDRQVPRTWITLIGITPWGACWVCDRQPSENSEAKLRYPGKLKLDEAHFLKETAVAWNAGAGLIKTCSRRSPRYWGLLGYGSPALIATFRRLPLFWQPGPKLIGRRVIFPGARVHYRAGPRRGPFPFVFHLHRLVSATQAKALHPATGASRVPA